MMPYRKFLQIIKIFQKFLRVKTWQKPLLKNKQIFVQLKNAVFGCNFCSLVNKKYIFCDVEGGLENVC